MPDLRMPETNHLIIAGRLTRDVDLKYLPSGLAVASLSIANGRHYKDKQGERKEETSYIEVSCFDKLATYSADNLRKGMAVMVEGRIKSESWEDKATGQKRSKVLVNANGITSLEWGTRSSGGESTPTSHDAPPSDDSIPDDDIPF